MYMGSNNKGLFEGEPCVEAWRQINRCLDRERWAEEVLQMADAVQCPLSVWDTLRVLGAGFAGALLVGVGVVVWCGWRRAVDFQPLRGSTPILWRAGGSGGGGLNETLVPESGDPGTTASTVLLDLSRREQVRRLEGLE